MCIGDDDCGCGCGKSPLSSDRFEHVSRGPWRGTEVAQLIGKAILFQPCGSDPVLIKVEDIEYVRALDNYLYVSRVAGDVVMGEGAFDRVDIDNREMAAARGWEPVTHLEEVLMGVPHTKRRYYYRRFEMGTLETGDLSLATVTAVSGGLDLVNNIPTEWDVKDEKPECEAIVSLYCETLFCRETCEQVREDRVLTDCKCPETFDENPIGFCWVSSHARCEDIACRRPKKCVVRFYHRCICA